MHAPHGLPISEVREHARVSDAALEKHCGRAMLMVRGSAGAMRIEQTLNSMPAADQPTGDTIISLVPILKSDRNQFGFISVGRTGNNDVVLVDTTLSKFHAFFREEDDGVFTLTDAGSRNGTLVEGIRVPVRGTGTPLVLSKVCEIRFGSVAATFMPLAMVKRFINA